MNSSCDVKQIYAQTLGQLMRKNRNIFAVDVDLMRIAGTEPVAREFPDRYVNAGIAEQNAVGVAAGIAAMGKTVFLSAFSQFLGTRASDQCLDTVCYNELNVKLVGTYAGISSGINGGTHISLTDLAAFRAMPQMKVIDPADGKEFAWALKEAAATDGPVYIRLGKGPLDDVFESETEFSPGKGHVLASCGEKGRPGKKIALITSGITTFQGVRAVRELKEKGVDVTHIHMGWLKPADEDLIRRTAEDHDLMITVDNHSIVGGLGEAVSQAVAPGKAVPVIRLGIQDVFCEGMTQEQLADRHGISSGRIFDTVMNIYEDLPERKTGK